MEDGDKLERRRSPGRVLLYALLLADVVLVTVTVLGWVTLQEQRSQLQNHSHLIEQITRRLQELESKERSAGISELAADLKRERRSAEGSSEPQLNYELYNSPSMCYLCPPGRDGKDGIDGRDGRDGRDGVNGLNGHNGQEGVDNAQLASLVNNTVLNIIRQESGIIKPPRQTARDSDPGAVYIRWGKSSCPAGSALIYKGEAAGSFYNHAGGGANYQCLSELPDFLNYSDAVDTGAWLYGAEYELAFSPFARAGLHDHNVPCAACMARGRVSKVMIPGQSICPDSSWTVEYRGYLMSGHHAHPGRNTFECVDQDAEGMVGGSGNQDGALFYPVQASCASAKLVQCPPYITGRELSCVVCTK